MVLGEGTFFRTWPSISRWSSATGSNEWDQHWDRSMGVSFNKSFNGTGNVSFFVGYLIGGNKMGLGYNWRI